MQRDQNVSKVQTVTSIVRVSLYFASSGALIRTLRRRGRCGCNIPAYRRAAFDFQFCNPSGSLVAMKIQLDQKNFLHIICLSLASLFLISLFWLTCVITAIYVSVLYWFDILALCSDVFKLWSVFSWVCTWKVWNFWRDHHWRWEKYGLLGEYLKTTSWSGFLRWKVCLKHHKRCVVAFLLTFPQPHH